MLKHDENYHLYVSTENNSVIGISLMYTFNALKFGLLDYIAVIPNYRGRDTGKDLFNFTLEKFGSLVSNGIGLLMEIQKESDLHPEESVFFSEGNIEDYSSTIILASGMIVDELNKQKSKTIDRIASAGQI